MNEIQEIDITIEPSGRLTIDVHGAKGPACLALTREMEQLLGGQVVERNLSWEYHETSDSLEQATHQTQGKR